MAGVFLLSDHRATETTLRPCNLDILQLQGSHERNVTIHDPQQSLHTSIWNFIPFSYNKKALIHTGDICTYEYKPIDKLHKP